MKKLKKLVLLMTAAAMLMLLPDSNVLQASAAEPTTYYIRYNTDLNAWRMQVKGWDEEYEGREVHYLNEGDEKMNDGDILVVLSNDSLEPVDLVTINAHLSNVTVNRSRAVIQVLGGIDECYVFGDSYAAINGDVKNAYVYDDASCNFNDNVTNLRLISSQENDVHCNVGVKGTVAYASMANPGGILREYYNFAADTFSHDETSGLMTAESNYSKSGSGPVTASAPAPAAAPAQSKPSASAYDNVPKTQDGNPVFWFLGIAVVCLIGQQIVKRTISEK